MSHTYADTSAFKSFLVASGDTVYDTTQDSAMLAVLEGASRAVDGFCGRSRFGSGFGPRIASNVYDHDGGAYLDLADDFLSVTQVTSAATTGETAGTLTVSTDYLTVPTVTPYRGLVFPFIGTGTIGAGYQVMTVTGTAGYSAETASLGAMATATSTATSITLTSGSAAPGMTLLADTEQMYVTSATGGTALTVVRAVNGTTAATHAGATTVSRYRYDRAAETATMLVAQRRWRQREAGVTGDFGGGDLPIVGNRDTERSILRGTIGHLRMFTAF